MPALRELFGGAITMNLPSDLIDASNLRQVPDTQEVFLSPDSDVSFIVEILQRVDLSNDQDAVKFHFDSLAHDNAAASQKVLEITLPSQKQDASPPATPCPIILVGQQKVRKFNRSTPDQIRICMALYRVETKHIDIVFTANIPGSLASSQQSDEQDFLKAKHVFDSAAGSVRIVDFGLFV